MIGSLKVAGKEVYCRLMERCDVISGLLVLFLLRLAGADEYCQFDRFNATCSEGEVIVMDTARYGRLNIGRCVSHDYGHLGCAVSVLEILDNECSGRQSCELSVPTLRDLVRPCPKDLTSYLEASYQCLSVLTLQSLSCNRSVTLTDNSPTTAFMSSGSQVLHRPPHPPAPSPGASSSPTGPSAVCSVSVAARPGQAINLTLFSFGQMFDVESTETLRPGTQGLRYCPAHVFVTEGGRTQGYPLCSFRHRVRHVMLSRRHVISVHFSQTRSLPVERRGVFIIKFEASGCPDLDPMTGAWMERFKDRLVVRCNRTLEAWYLTCRQTNWIGSVSNCSDTGHVVNANSQSVIVRPRIFQLGLVVAILSGIILGVIAGLTLLVAVFSRRQSRFRLMSQKLASFPGVHFASVFKESVPKVSSSARKSTTLEGPDSRDELEFTHPPHNHHHHHHHHPPIPTSHPHHNHVDYTQMVQVHCQKATNSSTFHRREVVSRRPETAPPQPEEYPVPDTRSGTAVPCHPEEDVPQMAQREPEELGLSDRASARGRLPEPEIAQQSDSDIASLARHCVIKNSDVSTSVVGDRKPDLLPLLAAPSAKTTDHKSCLSLSTDGHS